MAPRTVHDPGKMLVDVALAVALGGDCLADVAMLRCEPAVFGPVASDPTISRLIGTLAPSCEEGAVPSVQTEIMGGFLRPVQEDHPWAGWTFSAGWGSREDLQVSLAAPETVVEISADVSRDARGRLRLSPYSPEFTCTPTAPSRAVCACAQTWPSKTCHAPSCEGRPHEGGSKESHAELCDVTAVSRRRRTALADLSADQAGP